MLKKYEVTDFIILKIIFGKVPYKEQTKRNSLVMPGQEGMLPGSEKFLSSSSLKENMKRVSNHQQGPTV